jgi:hypothetical protein
MICPGEPTKHKSDRLLGAGCLSLRNPPFPELQRGRGARAGDRAAAASGASGDQRPAGFRYHGWGACRENANSPSQRRRVEPPARRSGVDSAVAGWPRPPGSTAPPHRTRREVAGETFARPPRRVAHHRTAIGPGAFACRGASRSPQPPALTYPAERPKDRTLEWSSSGHAFDCKPKHADPCR